MTHICVSDLPIIGSDNGLSPGRRQAIIWTNAGILLIWTLGKNLSEILSEIHAFSFKKMRLKRSSAKCRPFCLGLNMLIPLRHCINIRVVQHNWIQWSNMRHFYNAISHENSMLVAIPVICFRITGYYWIVLYTNGLCITAMSHGHHGVSNHYNSTVSSIRGKGENISNLCIAGPLWGNPSVAGAVPHKGPVMRKKAFMSWRQHVFFLHFLDVTTPGIIVVSTSW